MSIVSIINLIALLVSIITLVVLSVRLGMQIKADSNDTKNDRQSPNK